MTHVPPCRSPGLGEFVTGAGFSPDTVYSVEAPSWKEQKRKPDWLKREVLPGGEKYTQIKAKLRELKLHTGGAATPTVRSCNARCSALGVSKSSQSTAFT